MKKYVVNPMFKKEEFVECLKSLNVDARVEGNTIYYDEVKLSQIPVYDLPHLVFMNLRYMRAQD